MTESADRLNFKAEALRAFHFLETEYGMSCEVASATSIRYRSRDVCVVVSQGRLSYEIQVGVALADDYFDTGHLYSLASVLQQEERLGETSYQASAPDAVRNGLIHLASLLRTRGEAVLRGDRREFERMEVRSVEAARREEINQRLTLVRRRAEEAWMRKDFATYWSLLDPVFEQLTSVERRKVEYAKRHLG